MFLAVITLTKPPDRRRNTTNAKRPSNVSPNAMYLLLRVPETLSSSHSKPEMSTGVSQQVAYTKCYKSPAAATNPALSRLAAQEAGKRSGRDPGIE